MRKLILFTAFTLIYSLSVFGQDDPVKPVHKGNWLIEGNTGIGAVRLANTGFNLWSSNGSTFWNVGVEGGYFVLNRLAIKAGAGYGNSGIIQIQSNAGGEGSEGGGEGNEGREGGGSQSILSYKIGAKYYLLDVVPFQIDFTGTNIRGAALYFGVQGGYAFFLSKNVSVEPGIRYNLAFNNNSNNKDVFQLNIGFALHF